MRQPRISSVQPSLPISAGSAGPSGFRSALHFTIAAEQSDRRTIGLFMEVAPLVLHVRPHDSLIALMRQVAECAGRALEHRQYSVGHSARAPAFSALFNYMRPLVEPLGSLEVRRIHPGHGSNAISLSVEPRGETYDLWFDVNAEVAAVAGARRLAEQLRTLLVAAVQQPDRPLASLPLLPTLEAASVLAACSGPTLGFSAEGGCHAAFERQARSEPECARAHFRRRSSQLWRAQPPRESAGPQAQSPRRRSAASGWEFVSNALPRWSLPCSRC